MSSKETVILGRAVSEPDMHWEAFHLILMSLRAGFPVRQSEAMSSRRGLREMLRRGNRHRFVRGGCISADFEG